MAPQQAETLVGVIGGVGPLATAYFVQLLVQLTDARTDQEHVNAIVFNHASIPDRTAYVLHESSADPGPVLAADARRLAACGADFLVMPCNTAHYFTQQVIDASPVPFLSIVDVTVAAALRRHPGVQRVGLLATAGTVAAEVYHHAFAAHGVEVIVPDADDQAVVTSIIYEQVKAGLPSDVGQLRAVAGRLIDRGAAVVVLGCTELSVAAVDHGLLNDPEYLDSLDQLARETIVRAGRRVRP